MDWSQLGVGVASLIVLLSVVTALLKFQARQLKSQDSQNDKILEFFGNHMSEVTKSQQATAVALWQVADALRDMKDELRRSPTR